MAEIDVSSYKQPETPSPLDQAKVYQGLEQQKIGIDQSKLQLMNDHFKVANQEFATIADDPTITPDKLKVRLDNFAKTVGMPKPVYDHMMSEFGQAKTPDQIRTAAKLALTRGMSTQERINKVYGVPGSVTNNQQITPTLTRTGQGPVPSGPSIQIQPDVTTPVATPGGVQQLGPQAPQLPAGAQPVQGGLPGQFNQPRIPVGPLPATPAGPMVSQPPLFEEGKKQLSEDQALATERMTAVKPALQALPLLEGLRSGPTTEGFNKVVAALKANGIINITDNDPTAVYQEVSKKLAQYVGSSPLANRSDAGQILAEASTPSPKTQINPALIRLTKDAVILDRVQAARPGAFKDKDLSKYGSHRSTFPQSIDEKAFGLDLEKPEDSQKLVKNMAENLQSKNGSEKAKAEKFFKSLRIAKEQGFYNGQ